jgi:DNA-binding CsgD family transcriptional regulator
VNTVITYRRRAYQRLGVSDRRTLAARLGRR